MYTADDLSAFIKEQVRSKQNAKQGKSSYVRPAPTDPYAAQHQAPKHSYGPYDDVPSHYASDSYSHPSRGPYDDAPSYSSVSHTQQGHAYQGHAQQDHAQHGYGHQADGGYQPRYPHGGNEYERVVSGARDTYATPDGGYAPVSDNYPGGYYSMPDRDAGRSLGKGYMPPYERSNVPPERCYAPRSKLFGADAGAFRHGSRDAFGNAGTDAHSDSSVIGHGAGHGDVAENQDGGDYDDGFTLRDRQLKTLEIFQGMGPLLSENSYAAYVEKMTLAHMKPFPREAVLKFNIDRVFAKHGVFESKLPGYSPRKGQQRCANYVAEAIKTHKFLAVEAGTGTGKTFAYLVPPLLAGKSVIVSTRTKALQDQLISKDIPNLFSILDAEDKKAISLKGYSNYICRRLLDKQLGVDEADDRDKHQHAAKQESLSDEIEHDLNAANAEAKSKLDAGMLEYLRHLSESSAHDIELDPTIAHYGELDIQLPDSERKLVTCDSKECHDMCHFCRYFKRHIDFYENQASHEREPEDAQIKAIIDAVFASKGVASSAAADAPTGPVSSPDDATNANGPNADAAENKSKEAVFDQDAWSDPAAQVQMEPLSYDSKHKCVRSELIDENTCFVQAARQDSKARDVVAVNHALLCSALQSLCGMGREGTTLPVPDVLVIDEAHTFVEVFRETITSRMDFKELINMVDEARAQLQYKYLNEAEFLSFLKNGLKLQRLAKILIRSLALRGEGKFGLAQFKYGHIEFASPFEVMRFELFNSVDRMYLGDDSYTMKEVYKEMNLSGRRTELWFRDNYDLKVVLAKAKKRYRKAHGEDYNSSEDRIVDLDDLFKAMHKRANKLDDDFTAWVKRRFADLCARHGLNYNNINPRASDMADVRFDGGKPVVNTLFRALMADVVTCLGSFTGMLSVALERVLQQASGDQNSKEAQIGQVIKDLTYTVSELTGTIVAFMNSDRGKNGEVKWEYASWVEIEPSEYNHNDVSCSLTVCPIDVGPKIAGALRWLRQSGCSVVLTSATMTSAQSFDKFIYDLGLTKEEVSTYIVPAPFDYAKQACLLTSTAFPDVDMGPGRMEKCLMMLHNLIAATNGGIFILTTSYTAVNESYEYIKRTVSNRLIIKQGDMPVAEAMRTFTENGNAILIGTSSFWEGVDVPGKALSLVIIDKLPFAQITDPYLKALHDKFENEGRFFFVEELLPAAIITLRQGAGRLIRKESDTGALVILDPRVYNHGYSHVIFQSLPPMTRVSSVQDAINFLKGQQLPW